VLQEEGFEVTYLPVQSNGLIRMEDLKAAIRPNTSLVSIMAVNNEIGVIQPLEEIGKLCRDNKIFFHVICGMSDFVDGCCSSCWKDIHECQQDEH
jgi:cysteine sulfinate desulfinase/cysteine desulfurase-like protein